MDKKHKQIKNTRKLSYIKNNPGGGVFLLPFRTILACGNTAFESLWLCVSLQYTTSLQSTFAAVQWVKSLCMVDHFSTFLNRSYQGGMKLKTLQVFDIVRSKVPYQ